MKKMPRKFLITILFTVLFGASFCAQEVWPGDVNNNGIVNEVDLLFWGIAFGSAGPARDEAGTDWQAYDLPSPWGQTFPNGNNYAFADCNGDGVVDEEDYEDAIEDNYGLQHLPISSDGYSNASGGSAPRIILEPSAQAVEEGAVVDITFRIDDAQLPLNDFYGIALSLSYTSELLENDDGPDFELTENSWIESDNSYIETVYDETGNQGTAALAITRTNQVGVPVENSMVGTFSIVIEDIIVGLELDTFYMWVDSIKLINPGLNTIPVVPDTAQVIIAKDLKLLNSSNLPHELESMNVKIYPNPAREELFIHTEFPLLNLLLFDQLGRIRAVNLQTIGLHRYRLDCSGLPPGIYCMKAQSDLGTIIKKIIISH